MDRNDATMHAYRGFQRTVGVVENRSTTTLAPRVHTVCCDIHWTLLHFRMRLQ
jgi:hypothetical protein